jgi:hypothetical protein
VIVQIRAVRTKNKEAKEGRGFHYAILGPIDTLMNVRTTTQISRNDVELDLLKRAWSDELSIGTWVFTLGDMDVPLSWHLTDADRKNIEEAWTAEHEKKAAEIESWLRPESTDVTWR